MNEPSLSGGSPPAEPAAALPRLLVSVRNVTEAEAALQGGADWLDLKEPLNGPLGAVDPPTAAAVAAHVAGRVPISAALGELSDWADSEWQTRLKLGGLSHGKLGLANQRENAWEAAWLAAHRQFAAHDMHLVAVIYADHGRARSPGAQEVMRHAANAGASWILWDTYDKTGGPILEHLSLSLLREQLRQARLLGCKTVVAGSLTGETIASLSCEPIDVIAVRTAACRDGRMSGICTSRVALLKDAILAGAHCS